MLVKYQFIVLFATTAFCQSYAALLAPPKSFVEFSKAGDRAFVIISPKAEQDQSADSITLPNGKTGLIRDLFDTSGVYDVFTMTRLWEIEIYDFKENFAYSEDFVHWAWVDTYAAGYRGYNPAIALRIFNKSVEVSGYEYVDLMGKPNHPMFLPFTYSGYFSLWFDEFRFDGDRLMLKTADREFSLYGRKIILGGSETYLFSNETGALLSAVVEPSFALRYLILVICITLLFLSLLIMGLYRVIK